MIPPIKIDAATVHVYSGQSIQVAINAAGENDTIVVHAGTYKENLNVDKNLTIIGENKLTTIIDGSMNGLPAVAINTSGVSLTNFTIQNATIGISIGQNASTSATMLQESKVSMTSLPRTRLDTHERLNPSIEDVRSDHEMKIGFDLAWLRQIEMGECGTGVYAQNAHHLNIHDFAFTNGDIGIYLDNSNYAYCSNLDMTDVGAGVHVQHSDYAHIENFISVNADVGVLGESSEYMRLTNCDASHGGYGFYTFCTTSGYYFNVIASHNQYDGCVNDGSTNDLWVDLTAYENAYDGVYIANSLGCQLRGGSIHNNGYSGAGISGSYYTVVDNLGIYNNNEDGIYVFQSPNTWIRGCNLQNNILSGVNAISSKDINIINCHSEQNTIGLNFYDSSSVYVSRTSAVNNYGSGAIFIEAAGYMVNSIFANNAEDGINLYKSNLYATQNNIHDNGDYGIFTHWYPIYAYGNYYGCPFGPYNPDENPTGMGNPVSDQVIWQPFSPLYLQPEEKISEIDSVVDELQPIVAIASDDQVSVDEFQQGDWKVIYPDQVTPKPLGCSAAWTSDWLASAFVTTKLPDFVEGLDTNSSFVNQTTGEAIGENGTEIVTFGGPFVNPIVKRAENTSTPEADRSPVKFHSESGVFYFQHKNGTNIPNASLPASVINNDQDLFVIERYKDGDGRIMTISYGFGWPGTYAAGKYFDQVVYPDLETFIYRWIIVKWEDSNGDGFVNNPGKGDTYTLIATS